MAQPLLPPCLLPWGFVVVCITAVGGSGIDWYRSSFNPLTPAEPERYSGPSQHPYPPAILPPYLLLPMFRQQPAPFSSKPLFSPTVGRKTLPSTLENILTPRHLQEDPIRALPVTNHRGVEVWCGYSKVSVRVNLALLGFRCSDRHFRFGTCAVSRSDGSFIYFHQDLNDCGGSFSIVNEQLIYSNNLIYKPEPQGSVIRALPLMLHIQCVYNRFHYSYKIGYIPEVVKQTFRKKLGTKGVFSLSVYNEMWEKASVNESFTLGELMNFEASVDSIWKDQNLFVESCHATASQDPNSSPRYDLVSNFGCLVDSMDGGRRSRFVLRQKNILRFSIDAFLFPRSTSERFYLHCSLSLGDSAATSTAKSCTYSEEQSRWEELSGDDNICNCCDSSCVEHAGLASVSSTERAMVTSDAWSLNLHKFLLQESGEEPDYEEVEPFSDVKAEEEEEKVEEVLTADEDCENNTMMGDQQAEDDDDDDGGNVVQQEEKNMKVKKPKRKKQHVDVLIGEIERNEDAREEDEQVLELIKEEDSGNETLKQKLEEVTIAMKNEDDSGDTLETKQDERELETKRDDDETLKNEDPLNIIKDLVKASEKNEELWMDEDVWQENKTEKFLDQA